MKESWPKAISFTLSWEGGLTDDPHDPGGMTYKGISRRYWPDWAGWKYVDQKDFTEADKLVNSFYYDNFWVSTGCNDFPYPLDMIAFDSSVNPGIGATEKFLNISMDWRDIICLRLQYFVDRAKKNPQYLRGWCNRCLSLWNLAKGRI